MGGGGLGTVMNSGKGVGRGYGSRPAKKSDRR
jgi:hypothetical protein